MTFHRPDTASPFLNFVEARKAADTLTQSGTPTSVVSKKNSRGLMEYHLIPLSDDPVHKYS